MVGRDIEILPGRKAHFLETRRQGSRHDDPCALRPGARGGPDVVLYGRDGIESGQGGPVFTQAGLERVHVRVDQAWEDGFAAQVHDSGPRSAFIFQDVGARAGRRDAPALYRDRLYDVEPRVHGDDFAVVENQVRIRCQGGEA